MAKKPNVKGAAVQKKKPKQTKSSERRWRIVKGMSVSDQLILIREAYHERREKRLAKEKQNKDH